MKTISSRLFLVSLLFLLTAGLYSVIITDNEPQKLDKINFEADRIQRKVQQIENDVFLHIEKLVKSLEHDTSRFSEFLKSTLPYPCFVFDTHFNLYYWNNNNISPPTDLFLKRDTTVLQKLNNGSYLTVSKKVLLKQKTLHFIFLIPIRYEYKIDNTYLQQGWNGDIFGDYIFEIAGQSNLDSNYTIVHKDLHSLKGNRIFGLFISSMRGKNQQQKSTLLWLISISIFSYIIGLIRFTNYIKRRKSSLRKLTGFFLLFIGLLGLRFLTFYFDFPGELTKHPLFDSGFFGMSSLFPSFGDTVFNILIIYFLLSYILPDSRTPFLSDRIHILNAALCFLILLATLFGIYVIIKNIYQNPQLQLDVNFDFSFSDFQPITALFYVYLFLLYFLILGQTAIYLAKIYPIIKQPGHVSLLLYLLLAALVTAMASYKGYMESSSAKKRSLAANLMAENDVLGEYFLAGLKEKMSKDPFITNRFLRPTISAEFITQKIKHVYMNRYFDKYDVSVEVFKSDGSRVGNKDTDNYFELLLSASETWNRTEYENIFFRPYGESGALKEYIQFIPIVGKSLPIVPLPSSGYTGYIVIRLSLNKRQENSILPPLLVDQKYIQTHFNSTYNYGIFVNNSLIYNNGDFNYEKSKDFRDTRKFVSDESSFSGDNYDHLIIRYQAGKLIVISSARYGLGKFFSCFSQNILLFGVMMFLIVSVLIMISNRSAFLRVVLKRLDLFRFRTSFGAKIQLYIILASMLPLLIVIIASISIAVVSHNKQMAESSFQKADGIRVALSETLERYIKGNENKEDMETQLRNFGRVLNSDLHLFNVDGKLITTTQSMLFDLGLKTPLPSPIAYSRIREQKEKRTLISEPIGNLKYNSVYMLIESMKTGEPLGILNIPYYDSGKRLNKEISAVTSAILNVYIPIFLIFIVLSYFLSNSLTVPLGLLTEKLRLTTLSRINEPLAWQTNDEIGVLVSQYNTMLLELEESKLMLARTERESAWREVAQKVAHEIKNPLTPMKLNLQHLERAMKDKHPKIEELTAKIIRDLSTQIDILTEITTSFSTFARMPDSIQSATNIHELVQQQVNLFHHAKQAFMSLRYDNDDTKLLAETGKLIVMADSKELTRVFSNLILNGIQAVPKERKPVIQIMMGREEENVCIQIQDNGMGIPHEIGESIFRSRFTTKSSGSGLGLPMCKMAIENLKGKLWFESKEGEGATFFVKLKLC